MRKNIEKKYYRLFTGELSATIVFAAIWIMFLMRKSEINAFLTSYYSVYAFVLLEFVLFQGSLYWYLKLKQARKNSFSKLPDSTLRVFNICKKLNLLLFMIGAILLIIQVVTLRTEMFWYTIIYIFALVEYINYFYIRLSYLSPEEMKEFRQLKGFKPSKLAKELKNLKL
ncbi:hypothetical protein WKH56_07545 [Priestia sp. SB1]|uniref:hypothetical protein n=1 Tax=Priestia sp. SB1 TaxID=3132359 RepID=UPI0031721582